MTGRDQVDLVVAGAGILGLAVADAAVRQGLTVHVVERDERAVGASVRNFGHGCITAQSGVALDYALAARERWLQLRDEAGLWVQECGTVVVARAPEELAVLEEFVAGAPGRGHLLTSQEVLARVPVSDDGLVGGAFLPLDLRVNPRRAVAGLAEHLRAQGVVVEHGTTLLRAEPGVARTSRGDIPTACTVVAVGHDLDRLYPDAAREAGLLRSTLHMLRVAAPGGPIEPAVLTGTSLLRYTGFAATSAATELRASLQAARPDLLSAGVNLMLTQHPSGDLLIGDTHSYDVTTSPFRAEELDTLLLDEVQRLLGAPSLTVRERWQGTYAWAPDQEYLVHSPAPGVAAVAVTSGIGMTTSLGFAPALLADLGISPAARTS